MTMDAIAACYLRPQTQMQKGPRHAVGATSGRPTLYRGQKYSGIEKRDRDTTAISAQSAELSTA